MGTKAAGTMGAAQPKKNTAMLVVSMAGTIQARNN
jgi:hypothetical protein